MLIRVRCVARGEPRRRSAAASAAVGWARLTAANGRCGSGEICLDLYLLLDPAVRHRSATFRVPIDVTGNCIRETRQQQASITPAKQTTPGGGF